ncbi:hypothetical protein [Enhygromyxa salina]|nr:hypothetical protein [Enhygromyxa salina]
MEAWLQRAFPRLDEEIEGASSGEVDEIRRIVGHDLPRFYEWFLLRMGRSMGRIGVTSRFDYTARRVLWCYEQGLAEPDPNDLLIGFDTTNDPMGLQIFYDFTRPCRDDAMTGKGEPDAGPVYPEFETFREHIGWGKTTVLLVMESPSHCAGVLASRTPGQNAVDQLKKFMTRHGFDQPLPTGSYCGIFMRTDMTMTCTRSILVKTDTLAFRLGGQSQAWLRRFLGEIALSDDLELHEDMLEWGGSSR